MNGGSTQTKRTVKSVPDLLRNEAASALAILAAICVVSALFDAPIEGPVQPGGIPAEHVKAPWIFVGIQQMLRYLPAFVAGILLPILALSAVATLPWLKLGHRRIVILFSFLASICLIMTLWGYYS